LKEYSEIAIIKGCKAQNQFFQKELVLRYSPMLMTVSLRYTDSRPAAQDVLQDSLVKIIKSIGMYEHGGSFSAWMKRIVINTALKSKSRIRFKFEHSGLDKVPEQELAPEAYANLNAAELMKLIDALPDGYREIFYLAAIEGYSHKEIGELLQIAPSTSRSQLARARKILQTKLMKLEKMTA